RYYENVGTRTKPVLMERPFPREGGGAFAGNHAHPRAADWDNDGDLDLIVSARANIYLYQNIGSKTSPKFSIDDNPLPSQWGVASVGFWNTFLDWNNDGLVDVFDNYKISLNTGSSISTIPG
ncbi:unnamed protein product, partial [marine sediment metagenome]